MDEVELARLRRDYEAVGLVEGDLPADPLPLFHEWLDSASEAKLAEVNAMIVSTVGVDGRLSSRMVLCKVADTRGFVFYTNYGSRKATDIAGHPDVSLLFPWHPLGRQVRIEGVAVHVGRAESEAYFAARPRGAQLSAWASAQSSVVADRDALERRMAEVEQEYAGRDVPCPPHWGGIRVVPHTIEFWQGRRDRLHDRLVYRRPADDDTPGAWAVVRLSP
jgi:pyridoxamine 5'-phosphate oxidase